MTDKALYGEIWKEIKFDFHHINNLRIEISNFGRVRSFSKISEGRILKPSLVNGYKLIRLAFYKDRTPAQQKKIEDFRAHIAELKRSKGKLNTKIKSRKTKEGDYHELVKEFETQTLAYDKLQQKYKKEYKVIELKRKIVVAELVHRWVAEYFLEKPSPKHNLVSHLDFNKLNNHLSNLKWMTTQQVSDYRQNNPNVIAALEKRKNSVKNENTKVYKLTTPKVMLIKKKINEGVSLRSLSRTFKVTETQLLRIKRGINWAHVKAAP
jgi:hypothetical protein